MVDIAPISQSPAYASDRSALASRRRYDFLDYGFEIAAGADELFEIVPTRVGEEECFLFFFPREDVAKGRWALFNLHVFLKRVGTLEDFARSLGESVKTVPLSPMTIFNKPALSYSRTVTMADLFKGGEPVITFIGGDPARIVRDSHIYFMHRHAHCYSGVLHLPGEESRYDAQRKKLFDQIKFVD